MKRVKESRKSPMNASMWHLVLECGHSRWITGVKPPKRACCRWCDADKVLLTKKHTKTPEILIGPPDRLDIAKEIMGVTSTDEVLLVKKAKTRSRNHQGCPYPVGECACPMSKTGKSEEGA